MFQERPTLVKGLPRCLAAGPYRWYIASVSKKVRSLPRPARVPPRPAAILERCEAHGWVVLPIFSLRPCCLIAALQQIAAGKGDAKAIAERALRPRDERIRKLPLQR